MLFMRVFTTVLILIFSLQSWTKADDIKNFEIEGISVGDSLLDYMSQTEIINNDANCYHSSSKFICINYPGEKNIYEFLYLYVKRNDKKYKIYLLRAANFVDNKNSCLETKKQIVKEMKSLFTNATTQEGSQKHYFYKKSTQYISQFYYGLDGRFSDGARAECLIIHEEDQKKFGVNSTLEVIIQYGEEFGRWLETDDAQPS
tara:strand:- start:64 stop:669 length:606 start_codon:yes stop_codon:yes gene_type:complete